MKKPLSIVFGLITLVSAAQYNNTYDVNGNTNNLAPSYVITNKKLESITVSYASNKPAEPRIDYFILTKHDAAGTVIYNTRIAPASPIKQGITNVEALIQTDDEGVLAAGYFYDDQSYIEQPFLAKVDVNGNLLWSHIYYVNKKAIADSYINKISLCRVFDAADENYLIVASGDSDNNPGNDVTTNVIRVDATGKMLFSKKYYDANPNSFTTLREYPGDVDYSKKDNVYMITGYRLTGTPTTKGEEMYAFGINSSGAVVTKYLTLGSKSVPMDQDMVYDPNNNWFAITFTHLQNGYVPSKYSLIGFIEVDAGMSVFNPKYIGHPQGYEHNGRSISLCKSGEYLMCSGINDQAIPAHNPAFVKTDNSGVPTSAFFRYNTKDDVYFGHHANSMNPVTGDEEYVLVNEQKTDLRVIRTDINGEVCGVEKFEALYGKYDPLKVYYEYKDQDVGEDKEYQAQQNFLLPKTRKCKLPGTSYRTIATGIDEATASNQTLAYPSLLPVNNAQLTLMNATGAAASMTIHDITGKQIYTKSQLAEGRNDILLNSDGRLAEGIYLVRIYDADGELVHSTKVLVTK